MDNQCWEYVFLGPIVETEPISGAVWQWREEYSLHFCEETCEDMANIMRNCKCRRQITLRAAVQMGCLHYLNTQQTSPVK